MKSPFHSQTFHEVPDDRGGAADTTSTVGIADDGGVDVSEILNLIPGRQIISDEPAADLDPEPEPTPAPAIGSAEWLAAQPAEMQAYLATLSKPATPEPAKPAAPAAQAAKPEPVRASAPNPLSGIATLADLQTQLDNSETARDWAVDNWEGGAMQLADGTERELTGQEVRALFKHHDAILRKHAPMRVQEIQAEQQRAALVPQSMAAATEAYPWLADAKSEQAAVFQQLADNLPGIKQTLPQWPEFIADAVNSLFARRAKQAAAPATPVTPAPKISPTPTAPAAIAPKRPMSPSSGGMAGGTQRSSPLHAQTVRSMAKAGGSPTAVMDFLENLYGGEN
jgi:hypothetical protein